MDEFRESYTEAECEAEFGRLFPHGFSGPDVRDEIAFDKIVWNSPDDPEELDQEMCELVGRCVWDIFSDQHEVIAANGRVVDLGSFRGTGDFLADFLKRRTGRRGYDYMTFYLGTSAPWCTPEGDLTSIYEMIFRRLKRWELDWVYHFPQVHVVDYRPLREALDREGKPDWVDYSPSEAFAKEEEDRKRDQEIAELREQFDEDRRQAIEEALKRPPPARVQAYRNVYGRWPEGWPPGME